MKITMIAIQNNFLYTMKEELEYEKLPLNWETDDFGLYWDVHQMYQLSMYIKKTSDVPRNFIK